MKLFKIMMRHCAPKDCKESVFKYVIADDEKIVLARLDKEFNYDSWYDQDLSDKENDEDYEILDDDYNVIGTETYLEKMLRLRGEFNDDDASYDNAYYGVTHYGWTEGEDISEADCEVLIRLGVAQDWCNVGGEE